MSAHQTFEELREALARIKPGDDVSVLVEVGGHEATVTGRAWIDNIGRLCLATVPLANSDGTPYTCCCAVLSHTPVIPPRPEGEHLVKDLDGDWWEPSENGVYKCGGFKMSWADLNETFGPLTVYRPEGGAR